VNNILKNIWESIEGFKKTNRFPPNVVVLHPETARVALVEAGTKKGILVKNADGSYILYGMLLIQNPNVKGGDILLFSDSIELERSIREYYLEKEGRKP
jgi:hypothetical protein